MRFHYELISEWAPLAWLGRCRNKSPQIEIQHGSQVETTDQWFGEIVWAGDYAAGDFDKTDIVAGSGGRLRDGKAIFVSSGSTVDRLHSLQVADGVWVSNSLACLLAATDGSVDSSYSDYRTNLNTITNGIDKYERFLDSSVGKIELTYFDNLQWDGSRLTQLPKPCGEREFQDFTGYRDFLESSMEAVAENLAEGGRKHSYQFISSVSSGYDSATVTTLAKQYGCKQVICIDRSREGKNDSGEPLSRILGYEPIVVEQTAWRAAMLPEVPFIAADGVGGEVFFKAAENHLRGKVLLTGFHGGKIWAKDTKDLSANIVRGDKSGLSLAEYRLLVGFIHCPVPFWGVRQIGDVVRISNMEEMKSWDVPGNYSRPICRRIVEGAGVPREIFGVKKLMASVSLHQDKEFLTEASIKDYLKWLASVRHEWVKHGRVPPILSPRLDNVENSMRRSVYRTLRDTRGLKPIYRWYSKLRQNNKRLLPGQAPHLRRYVFPWAVEHAKKIYSRHPLE